jgi:hypothetical protein
MSGLNIEALLIAASPVKIDGADQYLNICETLFLNHLERRSTSCILSLFITGIFNKYIASLNKSSYFSISHPTPEDESLSRNGAKICGKR